MPGTCRSVIIQGGNWFPEKVEKPIRLLEHEVAIRMWVRGENEAQQREMPD